MRIVLSLTLLLPLSSCGSAHTEPANGSDEVDLAAIEDPLSSAQAALERGDLEAAERHASVGLQRRPSAELSAIAARVALASGRYQDAADLLEGATDPVKVRLRARAWVGLGNMPQAVRDLASVEDDDPPDGWAAAILPVARAAAVRSLYRVEGEGESLLPLKPGAEVPLVQLSIDGEQTWALVATGADLTVIDDDLRPEPGIAETIALGSHEVHDVPVLVRDLNPIGAQLGVDVGLAIGADVLLRFVVTLDFRQRQLRLRTPTETPVDPGESPSVRFGTLSGSFVAVAAEVEGETNGWVTLDSAGMFPVALTAEAMEGLGRDLSTLDTIGEGEDALRVDTLERIRFGEIAIDEVPVAVGLLPDDIGAIVGEPVLGTLGVGLLSQFEITIDPVGRQLVFR